MKRKAWKYFSGQNTCPFQLSQAKGETFCTHPFHYSLELTKAICALNNVVK